MARKYLVTEDEFLSAVVNAAGELEWTRDNGEKVNAGVVLGAAVTDGQMAPILGNAGSAARTQLDGVYPVRRVWDGSAYPARIPGAVNIFIGPSDPGLLMAAGDVWANPNVTTINEVVAAVQNTSSTLRAAILAAVTPATVDVTMSPRDGDTIPLKNVGASGVEMYGRELTADALLGVTGTCQIPSGWSTARVRVFYYVPSTAGTGDVRLSRAAATYSTSGAPTAVAEVSNTAVAPTAGSVNSAQITGDISVSGKTRIAVTVKRNGNVAADTLASSIYLVGVQLERVS